MVRTRRSFGYLRKRSSGRWQASYIGPDEKRHNAATTFPAKIDAEAWLARRRDEIRDGEWMPGGLTKRRVVTFRDYAATWMSQRDLKARTRAHYTKLLDDFILPTFGDAPLRSVTPALVSDWHAKLGQRTGPTYRAHAYSLLRGIFRTALDEDEVVTNPCRVRGAGSVRRATKIRPATAQEIVTVAEAMPAQLRLAVLLAAWCALRFGEVFELRRHDIDVAGKVIRVRRAVVTVDGKRVVTTPKSLAGVRDVAIPPHIMPAVKKHLADYVKPGRNALVFATKAGEHWPQRTVAGTFMRARDAAGRSDLRFHDLRHSGAVLAAQSGATLAELMARLGHSSPAAAMRYQHAAKGRDAQIAAAMSKLAKTR